MDQYNGYEGYSGKMKAIGKYTACQVATKHGVLERGKRKVGYATGSHVLMRQRQHHENEIIRGQVSCQPVATKMAVKFDQVRAGHKDEAEIDSYTPVMTVSHRFEPT